VNTSELAAQVITVSELNRRARELVEAGFPLLWVAGEISNFTRAASGHCYFSLKDAQAQVRCVVFRHKAALIDFPLANGIQVEVRALPTLYEPRGDFQLAVETARRAGLGLLFEVFERLKRRLEAEGLFEPSRKRALPAFPRAIGVVTSPAAAALHDVLTTLRRRMPSIPVVLYPAPVQGEGAAEKIAQAIRDASVRAEVDVLIVCRGGGSVEDLWAYNEEVVARAIAQCRVPLVSGIGHETDFTIADFVADLRAPTPTAAAAAACPDRLELSARLRVLWRRVLRAAQRGLEQRMQQVDYLGKRLVHPGQRVAMRLDQLAHLRARLGGALRRATEGAGHRLHGLRGRLVVARPDFDLLKRLRTEQGARLRQAVARGMERRRQALAAFAAHLSHLNPEAVLARGYAIVTREGERIVRDAAELAVGDCIGVRLARGRVTAEVETTELEDRS